MERKSDILSILDLHVISFDFFHCPIDSGKLRIKECASILCGFIWFEYKLKEGMQWK